MDKLGTWFTILSTLSTLLWFIFGLLIKNELSKLRAELVAMLNEAKTEFKVFSGEATLKHEQLDKHLEHIDSRLDRHKIY